MDSFCSLQQQYQTLTQIEMLAQSGTVDEAQALYQDVRLAILSETERHYEYTAMGGRGSPDGVAWESALKRALEGRLGLPQSTLAMGADGWYWA